MIINVILYGMKFSKKIILGFLLYIAATAAYSHPHTFIDTKVECEFDSYGLKGFWINWTFDPMFTSQLIMDYDLDRNGAFSKEEIMDLEENAFSNLINYYYFSYITENRKTHRTEVVSDFFSEIKGKDVLYRFFIPYTSKLKEENSRVVLAVYDDTFFCDIAMLSGEIIKNSFSDQLDVKVFKRKNLDKTIKYDNSNQTVTREGALYTGFVNPEEIVIDFRKK